MVDACTEAVVQGWQAPAVIMLLLVGIGVLVLFAAHEARTQNPLLPPRIVLNRDRGGAYLSVTCAIVGMFGAFLLLTYQLQVVLRYTPLQAGLAFLHNPRKG